MDTFMGLLYFLGATAFVIAPIIYAFHGTYSPLIAMPIGLMWYGIWFFSSIKKNDKIAQGIYFFVPLGVLAVFYVGALLYGLAIFVTHIWHGL